MKRLNVGSGKDYRDPKEGWINLEPNERFKADVRKDMRDVDFDENALDEILAQNTCTRY